LTIIASGHSQQQTSIFQALYGAFYIANWADFAGPNW